MQLDREFRPTGILDNFLATLVDFSCRISLDCFFLLVMFISINIRRLKIFSTNLGLMFHGFGKWIIIIDCLLALFALLMVIYSCINGASWIVILAILFSFVCARIASGFCVVKSYAILTETHGHWAKLITTVFNYGVSLLCILPARATALELGHFKTIPNGHAIGIAMWVTLYSAASLCFLTLILVSYKFIGALIALREIEEEVRIAGP